MTRKIIAVILLFSYLSVTAASALYVHYCDGHWMTDRDMMQLVVSNNHCPDCHQKYVEKDCCKHPKVLVKINSHQIPVGTYIYNPLCYAKSVFHRSLINHFYFSMIGQPLMSNHSPPQCQVTINSRQAFYGVFLI
jgi:hypothetical protein